MICNAHFKIPFKVNVYFDKKNYPKELPEEAYSAKDIGDNFDTIIESVKRRAIEDCASQVTCNMYCNLKTNQIEELHVYFK